MKYQVGQTLEPLIKPALTREQLKLYATAAHDPNPIHLDEASAKQVGLPGVIAHGMIIMAFMSEFVFREVHKWGRISDFQCRFKAMAFPGDVVTVKGVVKSLEPVSFDLQAVNQKGEVITTGKVVVC